MRVDRVSLVVALAANGMLVGATLDQAIKQLPARHTIGDVAYSAYSRAADLSNGVPWYAGLGVGTTVLTLAAVVIGLRARPTARIRLALLSGAVATFGHMAVTAVAAPLNFSQRDATSAAALAQVFDSFEKLNALRAALQILALVAIGWALLGQLSPPVRPAGRHIPTATDAQP